MSFLLVDGNSIGYASQSSKKLTVDGREVQAIYGTLRTLAYLRQNYPEYRDILVLWDGRAEWRYQMYPEYKGKRFDTPEKIAEKKAYHSQEGNIRSMLQALGVAQVVNPNYEADDLAGYYVRRLNGKKAKLITGDQDWLQLVYQPQVSWLDPRERESRHCNMDSFEDFTGFKSIQQFVSAKALIGDTSDNIKGVPGIGQKTAVSIMEEFGSVKDMLIKAKLNGGSFKKGELPQSLSRGRNAINTLLVDRETQEIYKRNLKLMTLYKDWHDEGIRKDLKVTRSPKNLNSFKEQCAELNFFSILRDIQRWDNLF